MEDILTFLKKYSDIDVQFITEFLEIKKGDNLHAPFTIDLEIVAEWLKTRKRKLKETLSDSYQENIDYISIMPPRGHNGDKAGRNKETILLSPDTFKMLTMKSRTKDAQKIRYYYVTLEKLVEIYKDEIIENQNKKIEALERNLKKVKYPVEGAVYILKVTDNEDEFKIGKTENMNDRLKNYNTSHKDNPEVVHIFYTHDVHRLEKCVKFALKNFEYRNNKEFYKASEKMIKEAILDCNHLITKFVNEPEKDKQLSRKHKNKEFIFTTSIKYNHYDHKQHGGDFINTTSDLVEDRLRKKIRYLLNKNNYLEIKSFAEFSK